MPEPIARQRARPRKAPRQTRSLETVQVIVEAAARILETAGLDGFSTNAVAERAGVSIGSLYQYFPRKDALIGALIRRETSLLLAEAEASVTARSGVAALSALILTCVNHQFRRPALARLLDYEEARLPLDPDTLAVGARVDVIVDDLLRRPDLPQHADHAAATRDVTAIIKGMVDAAGVFGESDLDVLTRRVERAVFGYLDAGRDEGPRTGRVRRARPDRAPGRSESIPGSRRRASAP